MSAEEEKLRLFQQAQAAVQKNQGLSYTAPPTHARNESDLSIKGQPSAANGKPPSAAATLYAQAINAQGRSAAGSGPSASNTTPPRTKPTVPQYLTADQEKAALRRYEEAKRAVDRTQNSEYEEPSDMIPSTSAPIAYESLFPAAASSSRPGADQPPPFDFSVVPQSHLSEKELLRRAYEANDAAARAHQNPSPPPVAPPAPSQYANAFEEKEALRKKFEARDNAQAKVNTNPTATDKVPSPARSPAANVTGFRPTPLPPTAAASSHVLSAAEEKALLRAKFEARDAQASRKPAINGNNNLSAPSTPPPLMPRPPVEYIKETQEEDARVSRMNINGEEVPGFDLSPNNSRKGTPIPHVTSELNGKPQAGTALDIKPSASFGATLEGRLVPGSTLPLPTKPLGE